MAEYLRDEVLAGLSPEQRRFVRRSAILDVLCASACDSVLAQAGSDETLAELVRTGFPLVAIDRTGERYRLHRLLGELLRAELHRVEPELEPELHRRASAWHTSAGDRDRGVQHALAADELGRAGDLVWDGVPHSIEQGSSAAVEHQLSQFTNAQVAAHPRLALAAAATSLAHGDGDVAEHWLRAAAASGADGAIAGAAAALHAALGRDGLDRMAADAGQASALLDARQPVPGAVRVAARRRRASAAVTPRPRGTRSSGRRGSRRCPPRTCRRCAWPSSPCSRSTTATGSSPRA